MGGVVARASPIDISARDGVCQGKQIDVAVTRVGTLHLCTCGLSGSQPYCDMSHTAYNANHNTSYIPLILDLKEPTVLSTCGCKHTREPPFCQKHVETDVKVADPCPFSYQVDIEQAVAQCFTQRTGQVKLHKPINPPVNSSAWTGRTEPFVLEANSTERHMLCACSQSSMMPICDGAHVAYNRENGTDLRPFSVTVQSSRTVYICGCGLSRSKPYCDGSHVELMQGDSGTDIDKVMPINAISAASLTSSITPVFEKPQPLRITEVELIAPRIRRIRVKLPRATEFDCNIGSDCFLGFYYGDTYVERPYTPLKPIEMYEEDVEDAFVEFVIKSYVIGKFSEYATTLQVGDELLVRGPLANYRMDETSDSLFVGFCAGIGIIPMIQLLRQTFANPESKLNIVVFAVFRREVDMLFVDELKAYEDMFPDRVEVHFCLTKPPPKWNEGLKGRLDQDMVDTLVPKPDVGVTVGVCGPIAFIQDTTSLLVTAGYSAGDIKAFL